MHANTGQEGTANTGGFDDQDPTRLEDQPRSISPGIPETPADLPPLEDHTPEEESYHNWSPEYDNWHQPASRSLEDIPEQIEDSEQEEDWDNGGFLDSEVDHTTNNTLRRDYSESFLKEPTSLPRGHEYNTVPTIQYSLPDSDYDPPPRYTPRQHNDNLYTGARYLPPTPSGADICAWETGLYGRGRAQRIELHKNRPFGEKT